jgi:hypothetical protein
LIRLSMMATSLPVSSEKGPAAISTLLKNKPYDSFRSQSLPCTTSTLKGNGINITRS